MNIKLIQVINSVKLHSEININEFVEYSNHSFHKLKKSQFFQPSQLHL